MFLRCQKGISLVEILMTLALIALVSPIVTQLMMLNMSDFFSGTKYIDQQTELSFLYMKLNRDFEMCSEVKFGPGEAKPDGTHNSDTASISYVDFIYDPTLAIINSPIPGDLAQETFYKRWQFGYVSGRTNYKTLTCNHVTFGPPPLFATTLAPADKILGVNVEPTSAFNDYNSAIYFRGNKTFVIKILLENVNTGSSVARNVRDPIYYYFDYSDKKGPP